MRAPFPIALALVAVLVAGSPPASSQTFEEVTRVLAVEVPVHVTHRGEPVRNLTADDFELLVGKKRQKLLDFEVVDLSLVEGVAGAGPDPGLPIVARRHFLLLFDLSFSDPSAVARARAAAAELVIEGLHPSDLVAVATYSEAVGASLVLGFTPDRRQLEAALGSLGLADPAERVRDPLRLVMREFQDYMEAGGGYEAEEAGTKPFGLFLRPDANFLANLKDYTAMSGRAERDQVRGQILAMSSSLGELADHLASSGGRKHVVLFSEGFDSTSLLGTDDAERLREISKESEFGQLWRVDSDERFGDVDTRSGVFDMLEQFRRCDCSIEAVDIGGLRAGGGIEGRADRQNSLFVMADQTGGELYRNYNDLSEAMSALLDRTSVTYLLTFQPDDPGEAGEFYPIAVKLKGGPKGARVVHRPGYYAPRPYLALSPRERQLQTVDLLLQGREGGSIDASVLPAAFRGSGPRAWVLTMIEIEGYSLLRGHEGQMLPTEIFAYALDRRGSVVDYFTQAIQLDLDKVRPALDRRGFKFVGHLELPPGSYALRVLIRNAVTGDTALRVVEVDVPAFDTAEPCLSPPFFIEPEGTWLLGQERRDGQEGERPYPLAAGGREVVPAARPILKTGVEIPLLLVGHHLDRGGLAASSRLVPSAGGEAVPARLTLQERRPPDEGGQERLAALFEATGAPGDYRLEVTLREEATGREVTSGIPVRLY